jgi:hypothetical protein
MRPLEDLFERTLRLSYPLKQRNGNIPAVHFHLYPQLLYSIIKVEWASSSHYQTVIYKIVRYVVAICTIELFNSDYYRRYARADSPLLLIYVIRGCSMVRDLLKTLFGSDLPKTKL